MTDVVSRLRVMSFMICGEAADTIEAQAERIRVLEHLVIDAAYTPRGKWLGRREAERAALAAQPAPAAVPPGMALVPIEPTPGIITTGTVALMKASDSDLDATREEIAATYRAMIAAAGDKP